jgi:uncharacterized phiE125 gp8 family phage protein
MKTVVKTAAVEQPITLAEVKEHLRYTSTSEDSLIEDVYIPAAVSYVEGYTGRALVTRTIYGYFDRFPERKDFFELPLGEVSSIVAIKYRAPGDSGYDSTLSTAHYYLVIAELPMVGLNSNYSWPTVDEVKSAVRIEFVVGQDTEDVDPLLKLCCAKLAAHFFENRNIVVFGSGSSEMPYGLETLIDKFRIDYL